MNDFHRILKKMKEKSQYKFAMATIVAVNGSSYRHPGAKMLFGEDGSQYGTISAGCLEEDLSCHAQDVILNRHPKKLIYDLRSEDDLSWGKGAGCDGNIEVYIEPCELQYNPPLHDKPIWPEVESALNLGYKVVSAKRVSDNDAQKVHVFYVENGSILGNTDEKWSEKLFAELKRFITGDQKIELVHFADVEDDFLLELIEPREQLFIFGAGPDVEPIVRLAAVLDFFVTIIDPRSSLCNERIFPEADKWIVDYPETYLQKNQIPCKSYVLIMTHSFERDRNILRNMIQNRPHYLGVLGPTKRTERLLAPDPLPNWIHSPIGLSISAEGPEEISVSIMAELIKIKNWRENGKMSVLVQK